MKPAPFEYHAPESLSDVTALLAEHGDEGKVLAGGQSLVPMLALRLTRFEHIVDLNRVDDLRGVSRSNGTLTVKAMTTQRTVEHDTAAGEAVPLLAQAIPLIGHFQIRNRGTVGGSIAHADPASELPAVALALDAELEIAGASGTRTVPASEFFLGTWTTSVGEDEILSAVHFPVWSGNTGFAVEEVARRSGDFALTGVVAAVEVDASGAVSRAGLSLPRHGTDADACEPGGAGAGRHRADHRRPRGDRPPRGGRHRPHRRRPRVGRVPQARRRPPRGARPRPSPGSHAWLSTPSSSPSTASRTRVRRRLARRSPTTCARTAASPARTSGASTACAVRARSCVDGEAVRSCLMFAVQADGADITTIEGIGPADGSLGPVQEAFRQAHGLQCGFCTPGFVVSVHAFLQDNPSPSLDEIKEGLSGNLCRCTGYQGIIKAVQIAAETMSPQGA